VLDAFFQHRNDEESPLPVEGEILHLGNGAGSSENPFLWERIFKNRANAIALGCVQT
jgi:hypothetical protein